MVRLALDVQSYRIIPSNYPPIGVFEKCSEPADLDEMFELEGMTNDRLQEEVGDIRLVAPEDRVVGPGSSPIMASFTHIGQSSRFTDGSFGVYYAALDLQTAIIETCFWQAQRLMDTNAPEMRIDMRSYISRTKSGVGEFVDLRSDESVHELNSYANSQLKARELKEANEFGIYYRSVRNDGGECIAALRPRIMSNATQSKHFQYCWDGQQIADVQEITSYAI